VGSLTGYVAYRSATKHGAIIKAASSLAGNWMLSLGGGTNTAFPNTGSTKGTNYIVLDGFEVDGSNEGLSANPVSDHCVKTTGSHHIMALNNLIHDCGGAGFASVWADWITL